MFKKTLNYFTYKIMYHMYINCPFQKYTYTTLNSHDHPAETHRLLKFLYHRMGWLVPAHNDTRPLVFFSLSESSVHIILFFL